MQYSYQNIDLKSSTPTVLVNKVGRFYFPINYYTHAVKVKLKYYQKI